jgi:hypothetical protein
LLPGDNFGGAIVVTDREANVAVDGQFVARLLGGAAPTVRNFAPPSKSGSRRL